jgi:thioredoxin 2
MNPTTAGSQIIHCRSCGAANRVPIDKLREGGEPVCGRCKAPLPVREPVALTDASFASEVEKSALPVLVDLWAEWCGPCKMIAPAIDQLAAEFAGRLRVGKLNIDQNPATTERFQVQGIPLLLLFKDGREVERIVGAVPKSEIVRRMHPWIE